MCIQCSITYGVAYAVESVTKCRLAAMLWHRASCVDGVVAWWKFHDR